MEQAHSVQEFLARHEELKNSLADCVRNHIDHGHHVAVVGKSRALLHEQTRQVVHFADPDNFFKRLLPTMKAQSVLAVQALEVQKLCHRFGYT